MAKSGMGIYYFSFLLILQISFLSWIVGFQIDEKLENGESQFQNFILKYNKSYVVGSFEYDKRLRVFMDNLVLYAKLNLVRNHTASALYGVNKFSDFTQHEFADMYLSGLKATGGSQVRPLPRQRSPSNNVPQYPRKFDWRDRNTITEPRDQKDCGGCWAFAGVETIESMYAYLTGQLVPLSVQEMIDCSYRREPSLYGCKGGDTCEALDWANQTKTVFVPESLYPLDDMTLTCRLPSINVTSGAVVTNYSCCRFTGSEDRMLEQISTYGPLTVSVDASNWNNYQGGVVQYHCGEVGRNHAVQIVGYDLTAPIPYYIVKNSWGTDFGHGGFIYIKYGSNVCLIAEEVSTVKVSEKSKQQTNQLQKL